MEILFWKILSLISIFITVTLLGGLPILLSGYFRSRIPPTFIDVKRTLSTLNSFAGGVFLATCMLELLPEARETVSDNFGFLQDYPITELIVILGVVFLLVTEMCIDYFTAKLLGQHRYESSATDISGTSDDDGSRSSDYDDDDDVGEEVTSNSPNMKTEADDEAAPLLPRTSRKFSFRLVALVTALSIHSIFDGIAIGVQTDTALMTEVFVAIMIHKSVFAFSLGVRLAEHRNLEKPSKDPVYSYLLCFASATPIGIALGTLLILAAGGVAGVANIVNGVLQSLAAGTLLYVTFFEILPGELESQPSIVRIVSLLIGLGSIALLVGYFKE